jgi:hypothetical protein
MHQAQDNLCAHARFLYQLIAEANEAPLPAVLLFNALDALVADNDIELIPKLWLLRAIMDVLQTHCRTQVPECANWLDILDGVDSSTPWMNPNYPPTKEANAKIRRRINALPEFSPYVARLEKSLRVLQNALNAQPRCVGSMLTGPNGSLELRLVESSPNEVWIVVSPSGQPPYFMLLADSDLALRADALRACFPGMPVFAPDRGHDSANTLLRLGVNDIDKAAISKPASWPVNAW